MGNKAVILQALIGERVDYNGETFGKEKLETPPDEDWRSWNVLWLLKKGEKPLKSTIDHIIAKSTHYYQKDNTTTFYKKREPVIY